MIGFLCSPYLSHSFFLRIDKGYCKALAVALIDKCDHLINNICFACMCIIQ